MRPPDVSSGRSEIAAAIRKLGRKFDPDVLQATYALYAPLQQRTPKDGVDVHRDLAYGEHERHRLDVHVPTNRPAKAPIVIYFHGGGYVGGERSPLPGLIYDNVPIFFARHGMIGVNAPTDVFLCCRLRTEAQTAVDRSGKRDPASGLARLQASG